MLDYKSIDPNDKNHANEKIVPITDLKTRMNTLQA